MRKRFTYAVTLSAIAVALAGCAPVASAAPAPSHAGTAPAAGSQSNLYGGSMGGSSAGTTKGSTSAGTTSTSALRLGTASTTLGPTLTNGGRTLYVFAADKAGAMASACTGGCLNYWPPVTVKGAVPKIAGVSGTLGSIPAASGWKQLTIDGHPLYTFEGDRARGDVNGQGLSDFGGLWWAVGPSGAKLAGR